MSQAAAPGPSKTEPGTYLLSRSGAQGPVKLRKDHFRAGTRKETELMRVTWVVRVTQAGAA